MAQEKKYDVFISYSRKDFDEVNTFVEMLKRRIPTLDIWFDLTGIESGDEFRDKIISAIKRSQYVLFALSINSDQSKWTRKELQFASGKGKKIVPILLKGSKLEDMDWFLFEFGGVSYVDITDSKQIEQLIKNLASWTGKAIHSNQLKVETDEPISLGDVQELVALGAKLGSNDGSLVMDRLGCRDFMETQEKFDVFISYSNADKHIVEAICGYLESHNIRCFVAHRDIPRGVEWAKAIPPALKESKMMLAVFSKSFNISAQADNELHIAAKVKIPVLTFRLSDDHFEGVKEYFLIKSNWIDAFPEPEKRFGELLKSIALLINRKDVVQQ